MEFNNIAILLGGNNTQKNDRRNCGWIDEANVGNEKC